MLNADADIFIPRFQATREIQTDNFGRPEFEYVFYLISIVQLSFIRTTWSNEWI